MQGTDVRSVLQKIGATHLHHANTVTTSCTFLEQSGLLSRGFVEGQGLKQTPQSSDAIDKKYGIWDRIFVDHVDIHDRAGRRKGPNYYGPVLFVFNVDILLGLPNGTDVLVTKKNPVNWKDGEPDSERWFQSIEELQKTIHFGDFDKMLVIRTPSGKLDFPNHQAQIILDDPERQLPTGENAHNHALNRLIAAAAVGKIETFIERRACHGDCVCVKKYAAWNVRAIDTYFG